MSAQTVVAPRLDRRIRRSRFWPTDLAAREPSQLTDRLADNHVQGRPVVPLWLPFLLVLGLIDGRAEAFTNAHFEGYIKTSQVSSGWERFLETTHSTYARLKERSALATALNERLHWRTLGRDDGYVFLAAPQ